MGIYSETGPEPPPVVTQFESFKTANFTLPLGPWYPGDGRTEQQFLDTSAIQTNVIIKQNGNHSR